MQEVEQGLVTPGRRLRRSRGLSKQTWTQIFVVVGSLAIYALLVWTGTIEQLLGGEITLDDLGAGFNTLTTIFLGIFIEAAAFLLLGVLMSAIIQVFITADMLEQWVPKNRLGATLMGCMMGLIFPVCECGSVPAARRLMAKGAPVPLGVAFLLAAPVINPVVIASTWVAFGGDPWIVGGRIGLTILIASVIALVFSFHPKSRSLLAPAALQATSAHQDCCAPGVKTTWGERGRAVAAHSSTEFFEMGQYVVLGAFLAALAQTVIPQELLLQIGGNPISSVLVMMLLALILSICSTVDAFVALSFATTFNTGAILAFLVFGPMIDIKAVLLFMSTFKRHAVVLLVTLATLLSFLTAVWINLNVG
ncbi:MAG: permease [Ardenticatenales bacterium]|nr:permease [Ardenticatenales bacterium]